MNQQAGIFMMAIGGLLVLIGLVTWSGGLSWFGNLPGDIKIKRESFSAFIPITSMIVISVAASALFHLVRRFMSE